MEARCYGVHFRSSLPRGSFFQSISGIVVRFRHLTVQFTNRLRVQRPSEEARYAGMVPDMVDIYNPASASLTLSQTMDPLTSLAAIPPSTISWDTVIYKLQLRNIMIYIDIASLALTTYDHYLTLHLEITHLWPSRMTIITGLYYLMRYMVYIEGLLIIYRDLGSSVSLKNCFIINATQCIMYTVFCYLAEAILAFKVWAVWEKDRRLTYGLPIMFAILASASLINLSFFVKSLEFGVLPGHPLRGCLLKKAANIISYSWICFMLCDTALFVLLLLRGIKAYRVDQNSGLIKTIYRDGILYYFYLAVFSILNLIIVYVLPSDLVVVLASPFRVLHISLISRVVLHTRDQARRDPLIRLSRLQITARREGSLMELGLGGSTDDRGAKLEHQCGAVCH
ncbi:hypothetical protein AMATHDRAFT_63698, partial [Amanita thiersii Skay4041]